MRDGILASCLLALLSTAAIAQSGARVPNPPSFGKDVVPILRTACLGCHSGPSPSGGYSVASFDDTVRAGRKGPLVVPGKSRESRLFQLVSGLSQPKMPPGAGLRSADVDTLRRWIDAGAKRDSLASSGGSGKSVRSGIASAGPRADFAVAGKLRARPSPVHSLDWSPDGKILAAGTYQTVHLIDVESGTTTQWKGHADSVRSLRYTNDGRWLVAGGGLPGAFGEVRVWDTSTAKEISQFGDHADVVQGLALSLDGVRLISVAADKLVKVWDLKTGKVLQTLRDHSDAVQAVAIHPQGKYMATAGTDKSTKVWDLDSGKRLYSIGVGDDPVVSLAFTATGSQILTGTENRLRRWNFGPEGSGHAGDAGHDGMVWGVDANDERIASVCADGKVRIFDANHNPVATLEDAKEWLYCVRLDPKRRFVAAGTWDGRVLIWDVKTRSLIRSLVTTPATNP